MAQNEDGTPHLAYFDPRTQASFVWNGIADVIEVCIGGYGEPVDHTIPLVSGTQGFPLNWKGMTLQFILILFRDYCRAHAANLPEYGRAERVHEDAPRA